MIRVYWNNINSTWIASGMDQENKINDESFWFVLNNNYNFNDCLLDKDYEYTFDFYDNKKIILTSAISTKNEVHLTGLHLHMTSVSIGLK